MKRIQLWLGHSNFSTTADIYAHLDFASKRETGAVIGSLLDGSLEGDGTTDKTKRGIPGEGPEIQIMKEAKA
ncbi:hypothetical protein ACRQV7_00830 [Caproiciproducens sp. R2]|uniref:hypothetical protein n=1 Tax=Caproiciproducens sp. R2 TaxID=3435187 RepID=UPI004034EEF4